MSRFMMSAGTASEVALIAIALVTVTPGRGQDPEMIRADQAFAQTIAQTNRSLFANLLDAAFTWTDARGKVRTRRQLAEGMPKSAIAAEAETKAFTYGDLGDVQVNSGRQHVLRVWVKRADGWKAIAYQEVISRDVPPEFTPGAGKDCKNPCQTIGFTPSNEIERQVAGAYMKLETAAHARNSSTFGPMVGEEFVAASSNSDRLQSKRSRMEEFDRSKDGGVAPTPLLSARMVAFGDAVLMISEHQPDRGKPLHVIRIWVKRAGSWVETLSYQTAIE